MEVLPLLQRKQSVIDEILDGRCIGAAIDDRVFPGGKQKTGTHVVKVAEPPAYPTKIFYLAVDRFDGTVGEPRIIQTARTDFGDHDKRIDDGIMVVLQKAGEVSKDAIAAVQIKGDEPVQLSGSAFRITGITLVEADIHLLEVPHLLQVWIDIKEPPLIIISIHEAAEMIIKDRSAVVCDRLLVLQEDPAIVLEKIDLIRDRKLHFPVQNLGKLFLPYTVPFFTALKELPDKALKLADDPLDDVERIHYGNGCRKVAADVLEIGVVHVGDKIFNLKAFFSRDRSKVRFCHIFSSGPEDVDGIAAVKCC